jgi:hypothetical protein
MGLSETILAAIIGALATMATAIVQLLRNRAPAESRPKKNRVRSTFSIVVLALGAMVGGYFYSELKSVSAREEIAALRADLKLAARTQAGEDVASTAQSPDVASAGSPATPMSAIHGEGGSAESLAHLPPCRVTQQAEDAGPTACSETLAPKIALCALVPAASQTTTVRVEARVPMSDSPWSAADAGAAQLGNLHLATQHTEYPASPEKRSVCLDVSNWSVEDTLAVRVIVDYAFPGTPAGELTASAPVAQSL